MVAAINFFQRMGAKHRIPTLVLLFSLIACIVQAVPFPHRIKWTAEPKEFVVSLYLGVLDAVTQDQARLNNLASRIDSNPSSRLDLFWLFINSKDYQATQYAKQEKEYQVYYQYVAVENVNKVSYYFSKFPSGAHMSLSGSYTFGVAAAISTYHATFDKKSINYNQSLSFGDYNNQGYFGENDSGNTVTDRAGRTYKTVKIGKQVWMAENLAYEIPGKQITNGAQWAKNTNYDGWCYYNNDKVRYGKTYGILYQWGAAQAACPKGWHVPSDAEWEELLSFLGGVEVAGGKLKVTGTAHWKSPNAGATNSSGFSALTGGQRCNDGKFDSFRNHGNWWSSNDFSKPSKVGGARGPNYINTRVNRLGYYYKANGHYVRCIKD